MDRRAKRFERALGMIACLDALGDRRDALGEKPGEQHGAFDLRARHVSSVCNRVQPGAMNRQGSVASDSFHARTHLFERDDHAAHRAARERFVSDDRRRKPMSRQHASQKPHRRSRVAGVERIGR